MAAILGSHGDPMPEGFRAVPMDWRHLTDTLAQVTCDDRDRRIVDDILDGLALHGHRHIREMRSLAQEQAAFERSQEALATRSLRAPDKARHESGTRTDLIAGWLTRIENMRSGPASHEALRRM